MLIVLLASFLSPAFAEGAAAGRHHAPDAHAHAADHPGEHERHDHHHGHALDAHDNLGHLLEHLPCKLVELAPLMPSGVAPFVRLEPSMSVTLATPSSLYRPPRSAFLA